jgi:hypothetical protein
MEREMNEEEIQKGEEEEKMDTEMKEKKSRNNKEYGRETGNKTKEKEEDYT